MVGKRMGPTGGQDIKFRPTLVQRTQQAAMADSGASRGADGDGKQGQSESGSGAHQNDQGRGIGMGVPKTKAAVVQNCTPVEQMLCDAGQDQRL